MILPRPPTTFDQTIASLTNLSIEQADQLNHKKNQDIEVGDGRVILKSPNGTRYKIEVDNSGNLSASTV